MCPSTAPRPRPRGASTGWNKSCATRMDMRLPRECSASACSASSWNCLPGREKCAWGVFEQTCGSGNSNGRDGLFEVGLAVVTLVEAARHADRKCPARRKDDVNTRQQPDGDLLGFDLRDEAEAAPDGDGPVTVDDCVRAGIAHFELTVMLGKDAELHLEQGLRLLIGGN